MLLKMTFVLLVQQLVQHVQMLLLVDHAKQVVQHVQVLLLVDHAMPVFQMVQVQYVLFVWKVKLELLVLIIAVEHQHVKHVVNLLRLHVHLVLMGTILILALVLLVQQVVQHVQVLVFVKHANPIFYRVQQQYVDNVR
eukprot:GHVU01222417.1.p1 GENE.GHVU01222417.1~~GHVU01222417.1.p1  ORF type:complete len:138 (+),score=3.69 GHVU01222417.1:213-626(+)